MVQKETERHYFDNAYESNVRKSVVKFASIVKKSEESYKKLLEKYCYQKKVLVYGCGKGEYAFFLSRRGADVMGIDISDVAVEISKARAREEKLENIAFKTMDAESTQFEDNSFEVVCGRAILHHLHLSTALKEVDRVLEPEGRAIFVEPMGCNPAINLYRKLTPSLRTESEKPLTIKDLKLIKGFFCKASFSFFHLTTLFAIPFRNLRMFPALLRAFDTLDEILFSLLPVTRYLAWRVIIVLEKPHKDIS